MNEVFTLRRMMVAAAACDDLNASTTVNGLWRKIDPDTRAAATLGAHVASSSSSGPTSVHRACCDVISMTDQSNSARQQRRPLVADLVRIEYFSLLSFITFVSTPSLYESH